MCKVLSVKWKAESVKCEVDVSLQLRMGSERSHRQKVISTKGSGRPSMLCEETAS
jgi:hypothetical protein